MYKNFFKRISDFTIAVVGSIILLPFFLLITLILYFSNNGSPFFFQLRPGLKGKIFKIYKFKTMNDKKDEKGNLLSDEERLTKIGGFIRKTSLDEIPQLLNVLKGQMSIIGPRPLLPIYLEYYNEFESQRHNVRPGITGLAAINGRNNIDWKDKMMYDIKYVKKISFLIDLEIFFKTILKIIIKEGVNKDGFTSTDSFKDFCLKNPFRVYNND